jgi:hypothetical protein
MKFCDNLMNSYIIFSYFLKPLVYKLLQTNFKIVVKEQTFLLRVAYYRICYITLLFHFA